jgi:hypothetical protein
MRYKAIAAALGVASLLTMGIMTAAASAESIGGAITTGAQGPITRTSTSFSPLVKATPPCGFTSQC